MQHIRDLNKIDIQINISTSTVCLSGSVRHKISNICYLGEVNLDVPDLLKGTKKIPTSGDQGNCSFAALAKQVSFQDRTPQQLWLEFQKYIINSDLIFPLEIMSHSLL